MTLNVRDSGELVWADSEGLQDWGNPTWVRNWVEENNAKPFRGDDFAFILGLSGSRSRIAQPVEGEGQRLASMMFLENLNKAFPEERRQLVMTEFCAAYIPALVEKLAVTFLDPPATSAPEFEKGCTFHNAYYQALEMVRMSPYFYKYLLSNKPLALPYNRILGRLIVAQIVEHATEWDEHFLGLSPQEQDSECEPYGSILELLTQIICAYPGNRSLDNILPSELRLGLIPWLDKWNSVYSEKLLGERAGWLFGCLHGTGREGINSGLRDMRKFWKGWHECGLEGCHERANLKSCSKCQTVRYCSTEHQKAAWNDGHRERCFETEY